MTHEPSPRHRHLPRHGRRHARHQLLPRPQGQGLRRLLRRPRPDPLVRQRRRVRRRLPLRRVVPRHLPDDRFYGYDGFLYSIGYLAGWIVALFVVAEPMKRLGQVHLRRCAQCQVQLARHQTRCRRQHAGRERLLSHSANGRRRRARAAAIGLAPLGRRGAGGSGGDRHRRHRRDGLRPPGCSSSKAALLVAFSTVLTVMILQRGWARRMQRAQLRQHGPSVFDNLAVDLAQESSTGYPEVLPEEGPWKGLPFVRLRNDGIVSVWRRAMWTMSTTTTKANDLSWWRKPRRLRRRQMVKPSSTAGLQTRYNCSPLVSSVNCPETREDGPARSTRVL